MKKKFNPRIKARLRKNKQIIGKNIEDLEIDAFLHCNDLTYLNNGEEELAK